MENSALIRNGYDSGQDGRGCGCCGKGVDFGEGGLRSFTKAAWGEVGGVGVATVGNVHDG